MFEQIIELDARAAAQGDYEAAYHLLMAALHCTDRARASSRSTSIPRASA